MPIENNSRVEFEMYTPGATSPDYYVAVAFSADQKMVPSHKLSIVQSASISFNPGLGPMWQGDDPVIECTTYEGKMAAHRSLNTVSKHNKRLENVISIPTCYDLSEIVVR